MELLTSGTAAPAIVAAFLASVVEAVEAFTVVLAVGTIRGWRPALAGTAAGLSVLASLVIVLGPALNRIPLVWLQLLIGVLLLLFGMRWLRKAILRHAGLIPYHDETAIFAAETRELAAIPGRSRADWVALKAAALLSSCSILANRLWRAREPWRPASLVCRRRYCQ